MRDSRPPRDVVPGTPDVAKQTCVINAEAGGRYDSAFRAQQFVLYRPESESAYLPATL